MPHPAQADEGKRHLPTQGLVELARQAAGPEWLAQALPRGLRTERYRQLTVSFRATLSGALTESVRGDTDPAQCTLLGSCGALGTLVLRPAVRRATATIEALAPARDSYRELLAAVGLRSGRLPRGASVSGALSWLGGGMVTSNLTEAQTRCTDSAPLGPGDMILARAGAKLDVGFIGDAGIFGMRTRCPGPGFASTLLLASARVPIARLSRRTVRISLRTGSNSTDDGYQLRTQPDLTLALTRTLTRTRVHATVTREPAGSL